ncbi:hypothetical protein D3C87_159370 [compost metagenome]
MNRILLLFVILIFLGCSSSKKNNLNDIDRDKLQEDEILIKNQKEGFVHFYKVQSFCCCLEYAYQNKEILKLMQIEDLLGSFDGLANDGIQSNIIKIAKEEASKIEVETYGDFNGKKSIMNSCLLFYQSKKLDSIARSEADKYVK